MSSGSPKEEMLILVSFTNREKCSGNCNMFGDDVSVMLGPPTNFHIQGRSQVKQTNNRTLSTKYPLATPYITCGFQASADPSKRHAYWGMC